MSTIYIAITFFALLAMFMNNSKNVKNGNTYLVICFLIMLILHASFNFEYSDNYGYKLGFYEYQSMSFLEILTHNAPSLKAEVGYRVFCKIISYIWGEWRFAFFLISVVNLGGYYLTTRRYSSMFWLSVLLIMVGPFSQSLFVLRQHMAMGIILLSYPFILNKKLIPYLAVCIIAFFIHQTAAIFLPVYFLYNLRRKKILLTALVIVFLVLYYNYAFILSTSASLAMETASYGDNYLEYDLQSGTNSKMAWLLTSVTFMRLLLLKGDFFKEGITKLLSIILVLGVILSFVGVGFEATARLNMYYTSVSFLIIPNTLEYLKNKYLRFIGGFSYFLFMFYFVIKNAQSLNDNEFWFFWSPIS